jgi:class 3 adenylate cyclase
MDQETVDRESANRERRDELTLRSDRERGPADDWDESRWGSGTEAPADLPPGVGPRTVVRTFAFLDLCGSTAFLEDQGPLETVRAVTAVRALVRAVTARRGVRVAKWLGDGVMLVGVSTGPVVAAAAEVCARLSSSVLPMRAGVAVSSALLFDGDDYLGRGANFASRLCDAAEPGEVLCDPDCLAAVPPWIRVVGSRTVVVRGMGAHDVAVLDVVEGLELP